MNNCALDNRLSWSRLKDGGSRRSGAEARKAVFMGEIMVTQSVSQLNVRGKATRLFLAAAGFLILSLAALPNPAAAQIIPDYPKARVTNNTPYDVGVTINYAGGNILGTGKGVCESDSFSVRSGKTSGPSAPRGKCLIKEIKAYFVPGQVSQNGEQMLVTDYTSSGTANVQFRIEAFGDRYRTFSLDEFRNTKRTGQRQSPGFRFVNHTQFPVAFSLKQYSCLYHDVVPAKFNGQPGIVTRDTGAVWFTVYANIQPDGRDPNDAWKCARPVVQLIGEIGLAAMTGGGSVAASGGRIAARAATKEAIRQARKKLFSKLSSFTAQELGLMLAEAGSVSLPGQYAGYEWPFRCNEMPEYHFTGGPEVVYDEDGEIYLTDSNTPFTVTKVNDCGNDMMQGSPKSGNADKPVADFLAAANASADNAVASAGDLIAGALHPDSSGNNGANGGANANGSKANGRPPKVSIKSGAGTKNGTLAQRSPPVRSEPNRPNRPDDQFVRNGPALGHWPQGYQISYDKRRDGVNGFNIVHMRTGEGVIFQESPRVWKYKGRDYAEVGRDRGAVYLENQSVGHRLKLDVANRRVLGGRIEGRLTLFAEATMMRRANWGYQISYLDEPKADRLLPSEKHPAQSPNDFAQFRANAGKDYEWAYSDWELRNPRAAKIIKMTPAELEAFRLKEIADNEAKVAERNRVTRAAAGARQADMRDEMERNRRAQNPLVTIDRNVPWQLQKLAENGRTATVVKFQWGVFSNVGGKNWVRRDEDKPYLSWKFQELERSSNRILLSGEGDKERIMLDLGRKRIFQFYDGIHKDWNFFSTIPSAETGTDVSFVRYGKADRPEQTLRRLQDGSWTDGEEAPGQPKPTIFEEIERLSDRIVLGKKDETGRYRYMKMIDLRDDVVLTRFRTGKKGWGLETPIFDAQ